MTDEALIAGIRSGDPRAERTLYDRHVDRVYRLAHRMTRDETLARDFTQDAFVRAFEKIGDFRGDSSLATWLHAIAVSVILNGLKKVKRIRSREEGMDELPDVQAAPSEAEPATPLPWPSPAGCGSRVMILIAPPMASEP